METNIIHNESCITGLAKLPDKAIHCCVTSPPYYGLRDYGTNDQIGLEETPEEYVRKLVEVFREVRRVLRDDGTLWLNLGDSYNGSGKGGNPDGSCWKGFVGNDNRENSAKQKKTDIKCIKPKDLIGIPWMVAFALRSDGWYLRQDIIWHKPNPMPESITDRCTKAHEYIFLLSKSAKYFYDADAIKEPVKESSVARLKQDLDNQKGSNRVPGKTNGAMKAVGPKIGGTKYGDNSDIKYATKSGKEWVVKGYEHRGEGDKKLTGHSVYYDSDGNLIGNGYANKRSVWTVTTKPFKEAHFATFPEDLIAPCIKAGCPEYGVVLDPFMGAGTTAVVARKLNRKYVGYELNSKYIDIAQRRMYKNIGLFI